MFHDCSVLKMLKKFHCRRWGYEHIYIYIYVYLYMYIYIYIYMYNDHILYRARTSWSFPASPRLFRWIKWSHHFHIEGYGGQAFMVVTRDFRAFSGQIWDQRTPEKNQQKLRRVQNFKHIANLRGLPLSRILSARFPPQIRCLDHVV